MTGPPPVAEPVAAPIPSSPPPNEDEFIKFRDGFLVQNEEVGNRFERIAKSIQDAMDDKFPADLEKLEDDLRTRWDEMRLRISNDRREGHDMLIPTLMLKPFQAKLALAHASRERADYERVKVLLDQVRFAVDEAEKDRQVDVKSDVLRLTQGETPR